MDPIAATFITFGTILLIASWVQLIILSFNNDFSWGLVTVFVPPLSYIYGCFAWEKAKSAVLMCGLGWILVFFGCVIA